MACSADPGPSRAHLIRRKCHKVCFLRRTAPSVLQIFVQSESVHYVVFIIISNMQGVLRNHIAVKRNFGCWRVDRTLLWEYIAPDGVPAGGPATAWDGCHVAQSSTAFHGMEQDSGHLLEKCNTIQDLTNTTYTARALMRHNSTVFGLKQATDPNAARSIG